MIASAERWIGSRHSMVGDSGLVEPPPPEPDRRGDSRLGVGSVVGHGELLGPRKRAIRPVARLENVATADTTAFDPELEVGDEAHRHTGAARVGGVAAPVDERPLRGRTAVVERRLADELELYAAVHAFDCPHEHVLGVVVRRRTRMRRDRILVVGRPHRQRVSNDDPA